MADSTYDATTSENTTKLGEIVERDLDPKKVKKEWSVDYSKSGVIKITYKNPSIVAGGIGEGKPAESGQVEYTIILQNQNAVLNSDTQYNVEVADSLKVNTSVHTSPYVAFTTNGPKFRMVYYIVYRL